MPQQITRGYGLQEVPEDFAAAMNRLKEAKNPLLNTVLMVARRLGWRTESLAAALDIPVTAASKRMERATPTPWAVRMRDIAGLTLRDLQALIEKNRGDVALEDDEQVREIVADLEYLVEVRIGTAIGTDVVRRDDVLAVSSRAVRTLTGLAASVVRETNTPITRKLAKQLTTLARRLARAEAYEPPRADAVVDASTADERWMEHMSGVLVICRTALERVPQFASPHPQLREKVTAALAQLRADIDARRTTAEEASVASARIREEVRILKIFIDRDDPHRASVVRQLTTIWNRLRVAEEYTGGPVKVGNVEVPVPPRQQTMLHGQALDEETIATLRNLQSVASLVNGGTAPGSPHWHASRKLSELLWKLNNPKDPQATRYTAYYLARVMGVTHHAVITRLRRYERSQALTEQTTAQRRAAARRAAA